MLGRTFALEVDHRLCPQSAYHLEELVAARAAILPAIAAGFHFLLVPADTDSEVQASLAQPIGPVPTRECAAPASHATASGGRSGGAGTHPQG
jgi:hypothetical protein